MRSKNRTNTHPGEVLREEFLVPMGVTQTDLANHLGVPIQRINELIRGKRGVTPDTAWLLAKSLGGVAVALACVNIFGGFLVTQRMLAMYKKKGD